MEPNRINQFLFSQGKRSYMGGMSAGSDISKMSVGEYGATGHQGGLKDNSFAMMRKGGLSDATSNDIGEN